MELYSRRGSQAEPARRFYPPLLFDATFENGGCVLLNIKPIATKPTVKRAQVEGSGTADGNSAEVRKMSSAPARSQTSSSLLTAVRAARANWESEGILAPITVRPSRSGKAKSVTPSPPYVVPMMSNRLGNSLIGRS
jgi:hypothetical protein